MSNSLCPCCEFFGTPPKRVNFIIITGLPWNSVRFRIREWLLHRDTHRIPINNRVDLTDYQSLAHVDNQLFTSTSSSSSKTIQSMLPTQTCCHGYSLILLEEFVNTDSFVWDQFTQDILYKLEANNRAQPVSWVIIDDKKCIDDDHLQFFLRLEHQHQKLLSYTFTIIFVIGTETELFQNCIRECVNYEEYVSSIYPDYQRRLQEFLEKFRAPSILQDRTLFIEQSEVSNYDKFRALIYNLPAEIRQYNPRVELFRRHVANMSAPCRREIADIKTFRTDARYQYEYEMMLELQPVFNSLQNSPTIQSAVDQLARIVLTKFKSMSTEQRRMYEQKLLCGFNSNDAKQSHTIAAHLTRCAVDLINQQENATIPLLYNITLILCTITTHRYFCHELFNYTSEIFKLSLSLICQRQYVLVLAGLRLCKMILENDKVEHKYAMAYLEYDKHTAQKIMAAINWLFTPYRTLKDQWETNHATKNISDCELPSTVEESVCLQHAAILVSQKCIQCLASLFYGSVDHCTQITAADVNELVDTIDILVNQRLCGCGPNEKPFTLMLISDLCTIFCPLLQYGSSDVIATLRCKTNLLQSIPETSRLLLRYGKELLDPCIRFYTMLMQSIFKESKIAYVTDIEQFITLPIIDLSGSTMLSKNRKRTDEQPVRNTTLNLNRDLISAYFELNREYQDILRQDEQSTIDHAETLLTMEWEKFTRTELTLSHARLKKTTDSMQEELVQLRGELERIRSERDQLQLKTSELSRSVYELRLVSAERLSSKQSSTAPSSSISDRNDENIHLELENLAPEKITHEKAQRFIQDIHDRRTTFNDHDIRKSLCGSLKHLGSDLYSSPVHFLYELIQNAEDNIYTSTVTPRLRIVVDHEFILLSNNEQGLRACDVSAICSLAVSTKQLDEHIGEKGVGFKSVFAASNQPTLISHAWKFAFHVPGRDEMSYITPIWIADDALLEKIQDRIRSALHDTHLYLPLKLQAFSSEAEDFLNQLVQAIDPCILINLRRLERLEIIDERNKQTLIVTKTMTHIEHNQWQDCITFEGFTFNNLTASLVQLDSALTQDTFRVYTANIQVLATIDHRTRTTTRILLAFPCDPNRDLSYNVYAGLPVCHLGFKFLFNADFQLVTNRESIRENIPFNAFLRNHLAALFVYVLLNENDIRKNLNSYYPSRTNCQIEHLPWWLNMVDRIHEFTHKHISILLNIRSGKVIRRVNVDLTSLVSKEQLYDCAEIELISEENNIFIEEHCEPVSIVDILKCFPDQDDQSNVSRQNFWHWTQTQTIDWWNQFYQHVDQSMTDELVSVLLKKPIFLLQTDPHRQYLPMTTSNYRVLYISDNVSFHIWKRQVILLRYGSVWERSALIKSKQVRFLTDEGLICIILYDHLQISLSSVITDATEAQVEEIWQDLDYLKSKIDLVDKSDRFLVPVQGPLRLVPIQDATLPTVLGANIRPILHGSNTHVIDFPYYSNFIHYDHLEWEEFFLRMNCRKPTIDLLMNMNLSQLPILRSFTMFTNPKLAEEIFHHQSTTTQDCLRQLPICAHVNGEEQIYAVSATFDKTIVRDLSYLPQVDVPVDCRSLAKLLGVICECDLRACVTVLQALTHQKNTDLVLYTHWLGHLQLYIRQQHTDDVQTEIFSACQIYLPDHQQFRPLNDLLVVENQIEHRTSIDLVSKYLNLPIISPSMNQIYWQFKPLFDRCNCTCPVNLSQVFQTIHLASQDEMNFHGYGDGKTVLTEIGAEKFLNLYQYLESLIHKCVMENPKYDTLYDAIVRKRHPTAPCGSREDGQWRFSLVCPQLSMQLRILIGPDCDYENVPILTSNRELKTNTNGTIIYACMEDKLIENLAKDSGKRFFVSPLVTTLCPLVVTALNIDYVERRGKLCWVHKNNNLESVLNELTAIFRETLQDPQIEVVTAPYINAILWLSDMCVLDATNDDSPENVDSYTFESDYPFWIFDKIVFLTNISKILDDSRKAWIATSALATLLYKRRFIPLETAKSIAQDKMHGRRLFLTTTTASIASTGRQYYSFLDMIFPLENLSIDVSSIIWRSQPDTDSDQEKFLSRMPVVASTRTVDDVLYRDRVKQQDHRKLILENSTKSADCKIVDHAEQIKIGDNAEHFFFRYLQKEYGIKCITPIFNWRSSSRRKLFPGCTRSIDDTLGYDFVLHDRKGLFVKGSGPSTKECYFEVKGIAGAFNVKQSRFHISDNEYKKCKEIAFDEQQKNTKAYFIVLIEHCLNAEHIGLAALINWSENFDLIHISPDSYICYIELSSSSAAATTAIASDQNRTQASTDTNQLSKPGVYIPPYRRN